MPGPISMTAFAAIRGQGEGALTAFSWAWDIRSVNGKGLDLRLRLPDSVEGLEAAVRAVLTKGIARGNVSVGLRLNRGTTAEGMRLNADALAQALAALSQVQKAATQNGVTLAPPSAAEVMSLRGVTELAPPEEIDGSELLAALLRDFKALFQGFDAMRAAEGRALSTILQAQIDQIEALVLQARSAADIRRDRVAQNMREAMARVLDTVEADPNRLAQELALLAVKADIAEELDRLDAHILAARALLAQGGPVGRKLDFLSQEFNREANTLCSKAGDITLTQIGLDLKHLIDQMREQVQNLE